MQSPFVKLTASQSSCVNTWRGVTGIVTAARFRRLHIWLCPCMVFKCVNFICKLDVARYWFTWSGHCLMWLSCGAFSVAFFAAVCVWMSTRKAAYFLRSLRANKLVCTTSFLRVFHGTVFGSLPGSLTSSVVFLRAFLLAYSCVNSWLKSWVFRRFVLFFSVNRVYDNSSSQ